MLIDKKLNKCLYWEGLCVCVFFFLPLSKNISYVRIKGMKIMGLSLNKFSYCGGFFSFSFNWLGLTWDLAE